MGILKSLFALYSLGNDAVGRRVPDDLFDSITVRSRAAYGVADQGRPTEKQIRDNNRGVFAELVNLRAKAIGRVMADAQVVRYLADGTVIEVEPTHPWQLLIRRPNPTRASIDVWRWVSIMRDLSGPADFVVQRDGLRVPIGLHEVFPVFGQMYPVPDGQGGVERWRFERSDGQTRYLDVDDVVRIRMPDPVSPYETMSLMEKAAFELDKTTYADVYERDMLRDGRMPPMALETDQDLDPTQIAQLRSQFKTLYQTAGDVQGVPILPNGLKAKTLNLNAADLGLSSGRQLTDTHLFWLSGIPQGYMSDTANRANADAAQRIFAQTTVGPEAESIAGQLTIAFERIFKSVPGALESITPDPVPVDELEQSMIDERRIRSGLASPNEIRERDGQDMIEGGNQYFLPLGLEAYAGEDMPEPQPIPPALAAANNADPPDQDEPDDDDESDPADDSERSFNSAGRSAVQGDPSRMNDRVAQILRADGGDKYWRRVKRARRGHEGAVQAQAIENFDRQADDVVSRLYDLVGDSRGRAGAVARGTVIPPSLSVEALFDLEYWIQFYLDTFAPLTAEALAGGYDFASIAFELPGNIPLDAPRVVQILDALAGRTKTIPLNTMYDLTPVIEDAIRNRSSVDELAAQIRGYYDGVKPWRSRIIAQTTVTGAFEAGQLEAFYDAGATGKQWFTQRDGRVRVAHQDLESLTIPLDQTWTSFDPRSKRIPYAELRFPGDPEANAPNHTIQCRCSMVPVFGDLGGEDS